MTSEIPERSHREVAAEHIRHAQQAADAVIGVGTDAQCIATIQRRLDAALEELDAAEVRADE